MELLSDAQQLARRRPALFVGAAFAIGVLGARFLKSSAADDNSRFAYRDRTIDPFDSSSGFSTAVNTPPASSGSTATERY